MRDALRHDQPLLRYRPANNKPALWSDTTVWTDLCHSRSVPDLLGLPQGWARNWTITYRHGDREYTTPVADASLSALMTADPIRVNHWHRNRRARAGLRYLHSTGRLHAHESLFERKLLLALDFHGVTDVAAQPFTLTWHDGTRERNHTPDFLALIDGRPVVINTRPLELVNDAMIENAGAVAEMSATHGWAHALVVGYPLPALTTVETVEVHATTNDPFEYLPQITEFLDACGPSQFSRICEQFDHPLVARAALQRLLWERRARINLNQPLEDTTIVLPAEGENQ